MLFAVARPLFAGESAPTPRQSVVESIQEFAAAHGVAGCIAAGFLALLLILHNVLKAWITAAFNRLGMALKDRLAGTRLIGTGSRVCAK